MSEHVRGAAREERPIPKNVKSRGWKRRGLRRLLVGGVIALASILVAPEAAFGQDVWLGAGSPVGYTLWTGWSLDTGTGCYVINQSSDANIVHYCGWGVGWHSNTVGDWGDYLTLQGDGNVVVYSAGGAVRFQTGTNGYNGSYYYVQDDGNIVVYAANGAPVWARSWTQDVAGSKTYAAQIFFHYGWDVGSQFGCLDNVYIRESGWHWNADNPTSSAYGIPQALPGSKMGAAGNDWSYDGLTQIQWGLNYIASRYGTPCGAWSYWQSHGNY